MNSTNAIGKKFAAGLFYLVAAIAFTYTSILTFSFIHRILPEQYIIVPIFALVVFDFGCLAWLIVYINHAQGAGQRAVAMGLTATDLIGVALMIFAEVLTSSTATAEAMGGWAVAATWGIPVWTVFNLVGLVLFHLADPEAQRKMAMQQQQDKLFAASIKKMEERGSELASHVANVLGEQGINEILASMGVNHQQLPEVLQIMASQINADQVELVENDSPQASPEPIALNGSGPADGGKG